MMRYVARFMLDVFYLSLGIIPVLLISPTKNNYSSGGPSTGKISISVGVSYSTHWEMVDNKPTLTVSASTLSHPGDIRVEVWRIEENALGGRLSTKIDFFEWRGERGKPANMTWTFYGKARPVEYGDEIIFTPWGRTGK